MAYLGHYILEAFFLLPKFPHSFHLDRLSLLSPADVLYTYVSRSSYTQFFSQLSSTLFNIFNITGPAEHSCLFLHKKGKGDNSEVLNN
uniref:Uncharacterized protein n=1 Tax=Octopus bimaculoides TaxID=37653 RepID=A0A0L8HIV3_OCTBM